MNIRETLLKSIETGFIDQHVLSNKAFRPEILINDQLYGKKVLTTLLNELGSCDEFWFSVAFVTAGGVATLMNTLADLEDRNIKGKILASQYLNFTQPEALRKLKQFSNIELFMATEGQFHSKGYLFRKDGVYDLIIGSSNLTQSALSINKEWNLKISATENSELIRQAINEFKIEFESAQTVTGEFITEYEKIWSQINSSESQIKSSIQSVNKVEIRPNSMQQAALKNIERLRSRNEKKALIISATGTGKTHLSAFDVREFKPEKFLFIVHRRTIAEESMKTYKDILGPELSMGIYSGSQQELEADYLFSTIQTLSRSEHLEKFAPDHFDYIVIDETHRAGADSYKRILDHFEAKFLLGMTATPERTDGADIFQYFDHNIAYEIRLQGALSAEMLSPFHYYGVTDLTINDQEIDELTDFNLLTAHERVNRILEKAEFFGCDNGNIRGLVFCSRNEISIKLSEEFNNRGYKTVALSGGSSEDERQLAIKKLESENEFEKLDYIFTVDIFNEGIDIPRVNQIIMLRPTQSAIIFVQQLGRGLRKIASKSYLTVIDFIGNYTNNYLVPIALYGDTSYNKDSLRKIISSGSSWIPGTSTVNFDKISKERIFTSIDSTNMHKKMDLKKDYDLLKFKLGRIPMMVDFLEHGSRDPMLYVNYSKSYFNFVAEAEDRYQNVINNDQMKLLELFSGEINNSKRIEESLMLRDLLDNGSVDIDEFKNLVMNKYGYTPSDKTIESCIFNLNFEFVTERKSNRLMSVRKIYNYNIIRREGNKLLMEDEFMEHLSQKDFATFLWDSINYSLKTYDEKYEQDNFIEGFQLYKKYSRKDVFRILNWEENPVAQNVGGYIIDKDKTNCPIFVNYHKAEDISSTTKYEDGFVNPSTFEWMSKSRRNLNSKDVQSIRNYKDGLRLPLFIKKSNDEGTEFYYMGDISPIDDSFVQTTMEDDSGNEVSVVKIVFTMDSPVESNIYKYITESN